MSHTLWFDARRGLIELFVFGQRQCQVRLPEGDVRVESWQTGLMGDVCRGRVGARKFWIMALPEVDGWVIRVEGENPTLEVFPLRAKWMATADGKGMVTEPGHPDVSRHTFLKLRMKSYGAVGLRGNGSMAEGEDGRWVITGRPGSKELTVALAGATGVWRKTNAEPYLYPWVAAERRAFGVGEKECWFDVGGSLGEEKRTAQLERKTLVFTERGVEWGGATW